jgi:DNA-binding transcriptional MerR regulator
MVTRAEADRAQGPSNHWRSHRCDRSTLYTVNIETGREFTLEELVQEVGDWIARERITHESRRVTTKPDGRILRYYTTLGLMDPPMRVRDRKAVYGERHLFQVVLIKRRQAEGMSLSDIQAAQELSLPTDLLRKKVLEAAAAHDRSDPGDPEPGSRSTPAEAAPVAGTANGRDRGRRSRVETPAPDLRGIRLGGGAILLVPAERVMGERDLVAIRRAARGLIEHLVAAGLVSDAETSERDE